MAFRTKFAAKPRVATSVKPVTGTLVRIVLLGVLAIGGTVEGIYLYYTHAFRPQTRPIPSASASSGVIEVEVQ